MGKTDDYRKVLSQLKDWDQYLLDESCLPGPRGNLELAAAVAEEGDIEKFRHYLSYGPEEAPYGSALEFLPVCGVIGLGRLSSQGHTELLADLRRYASDPRWRVREAVAISLQKYGDSNMDGLLLNMEQWVTGNLLEKRAVAATVCEPRLLKERKVVKRVLGLLDHITEDLHRGKNRKSDEFKTLRKSLGYCWSVALAADPEAGKEYMEKWFQVNDPDIQWIMKENLKKNRLRKADTKWAKFWEEKLTSK